MFILLAVVFYQLLNPIVEAADTVSRWVTKSQVQKAEELGAIKRTQLEVVNNYGEQSTIDTNQLQGSRNE